MKVEERSSLVWSAASLNNIRPNDIPIEYATSMATLTAVKRFPDSFLVPRYNCVEPRAFGHKRREANASLRVDSNWDTRTH